MARFSNSFASDYNRATISGSSSADSITSRGENLYYVNGGKDIIYGFDNKDMLTLDKFEGFFFSVDFGGENARAEAVINVDDSDARRAAV